MTFFHGIFSHKYKLLSLVFLGIMVHYIYPVYDSYAHRDKVPLPPFGWTAVPSEAPVTEKLIDPQYRVAASNVLHAMETRRMKIGAPSYSAAVAIKGKLVWAGALGWANIDNNIKATPDTIYRVGSTSKAITATALARLVDASIIDLDMPISTYMKDLPNETWSNITSRQLASHMAGLSHYAQKGVKRDLKGLYGVIAMQKHYDNVTEALEIFDGTSLRSAPGSEFYYSSQGTVLLGAVMSAAAEKPYLQIIKEEVLQPNQMHATIIAPVKSNGENNIATSYKRRGANIADRQVRPWRAVDLSSRLPGGGFASTPSDLVKVGLAYFDESKIKAETRDAFWTPQKLLNGETNPQNYAIGWRFQGWPVEGLGKVENANHGGVSRGAQSLLMVIPEHEMVIAFNANIKTDNYPEFGRLYKDIIREFVTVLPAK